MPLVISPTTKLSSHVYVGLVMPGSSSLCYRIFVKVYVICHDMHLKICEVMHIASMCMAGATGQSVTQRLANTPCLRRGVQALLSIPHIRGINKLLNIFKF